jgi:phage protein D
MVNGTELRHGVTVDVLSVSVTESFDQVDTFSITVRDRHPEAGRIFAGGDELQWMDSDVFDEGNEVEIHMGYMDDLYLMLVGEITAASSSFPASGQPTLSVQGSGLYHRLQRETRRQPFKSATDSGIAEEIASEMGLKAEVDATETEHELVSPSGESYADILTQRAQRIGYEVAVKGRTLHFQRPRYIDNPSATLTLEWGRDLISFNPRLSTYNATTEVTVRSSQTSQGRGKEPIVGTAQVGDERVRMGEQTGQQVAQEVFGERHVLVNDHNVASQQEANEIARAQLEAQGMEYITGRGSCVGNPELTSRTVVELTGLGRRFSGIYYVTSTTHNIGSGGYLTDFEVKRNAR